MKLTARLFALSLVVTGAVASTQIHNSASDMMAPKMGLIPPAVCPPVGTDCHMGD